MDTPIAALLFLACIFVGFWFGYMSAHENITADCKGIHQFRYGQTIYHCEPQK